MEGKPRGGRLAEGGRGHENEVLRLVLPCKVERLSAPSRNKGVYNLDNPRLLQGLFNKILLAIKSLVVC